jgi:hypothetical protein
LRPEAISRNPSALPLCPEGARSPANKEPIAVVVNPVVWKELGAKQDLSQVCFRAIYPIENSEIWFSPRPCAEISFAEMQKTPTLRMKIGSRSARSTPIVTRELTMVATDKVVGSVHESQERCRVKEGSKEVIRLLKIQIETLCTGGFQENCPPEVRRALTAS